MTQNIAHLDTKLIEANALTHGHIGRIIRFRTYSAIHQVATVITAELRQLSMDGSDITLIYGAGNTVVHPDYPISLDPPDDYSDMPALLDAIAVHEEQADR